ncbi:MAG: o-succinylbenzoate synthase [Halobacteriales archaeon]|nr:o-succinylbenzoate synthase [Halobacteriales archaeon]
MTGVGGFSLPLSRPLETAVGSIERREGFLIRLGDGPVGIGEATPLPGWTEDLDRCLAAIEDAIDGASSLDSRASLPVMTETPAARHGLELAVLDRAARAAGEPLYRQLGGHRRVSTVPVNATVGDAGVEETVQEAEEAVAAGFGTVKLKVGARSVDEDLARVEAVRTAVGDGPELRVDVNAAWSAETADQAVAALDDLDVSLVEQPLAPDDLDGHAALRGQGVEIALDETLRTHAVDAIVEAGAADVLVLKPMVLGGVGRALEVAERATAAGLGVIVTTTVDGAVARTAAVHLAAALDIDRACGLATAELLAQDLGSDPAPVVDGGISVPQGAGHGVGVEELD